MRLAAIAALASARCAGEVAGAREADDRAYAAAFAEERRRQAGWLAERLGAAGAA